MNPFQCSTQPRDQLSVDFFFFNFLASLFRSSLFYVREARAEYGMKIAENVELKMILFQFKNRKSRENV